MEVDVGRVMLVEIVQMQDITFFLASKLKQWCHNFDLTRKISESVLKSAEKNLVNVVSEFQSENLNGKGILEDRLKKLYGRMSKMIHKYNT